MDIRYLRSFIAVAECLNFTEAAKQLFIAQPVLSRQIALLEEQLGVKLFFRNNRSVQLTAAGNTLFQEAGNLLSKIEDIVDKTRQSHTGASGQLTIGCFGVESEFLPKIIGRFRAAYPRIKLNIEQVRGKMLDIGLKNGDLDVAFNGYLGSSPSISPFMQCEVRRSKICFLLPNNHPFAHLSSINFSSLSRERFILLSEEDCPQGCAWFYKQCEQAGFVPNVVSHTTRMETTFWEVEAGIGISFTLHDPIIQQTYNARISLVDMEGDDAYGSNIITWVKDNPNPSIPFFIKEFENIP